MNWKKILLWIGGIIICLSIISSIVSSSSETIDHYGTSNETINSEIQEEISQQSVKSTIQNSPVISNPYNYLIPTGDGYINSKGNYVPSPAYSPTIPAGATAQCKDGTYSFSQSRRGTCSHHGGVARWL